MKKLAKSAVLVLSLAIVMMVGGTAFAGAAVNLGFETGDLTGWTGTGAAVGSLAPNFPAPPSGTKMLRNSGPACASNTVSQAGITLKAGRSISGVAGFQATDYLPYNDSVSVVVNGDTVYKKSISDVGNFGHAKYQQWVYTAVADGDVTVEYVSTNALDCIGTPIILGDSVLTNLSCAAILPALALSCTLTDAATGAGIGGESISFDWGGPSGGSAVAVTNAAGVATDSSPTDVLGATLNLGYGAEFLGSINANGSSASGALI